jgi:hypothetical protein
VLDTLQILSIRQGWGYLAFSSPSAPSPVLLLISGSTGALSRLFLITILDIIGLCFGDEAKIDGKRIKVKKRLS